MHNLKLGRLGDDFFDAEGLLQFVKQKDILDIYNTLCGLPSKECLSCDLIKNCGGGCVCQWTNFTYDQLINR